MLSCREGAPVVSVDDGESTLHRVAGNIFFRLSLTVEILLDFGVVTVGKGFSSGGEVPF